MTIEIPTDVQEVIEAHDCQVLHDLAGTEETSGDVPVVCLGWPQELSAGLRGGKLTPWFETADELWKYVRENRQRLLADAELPD